MTQSPLEFYQSQLKKHTEALQKTKKQLAVSSTIRLAIFLLLCFLIYWFFGNMQVLIPTIVVGIATFLYLVSRHSELQYRRDIQKAIIDQNETEIQVLNGAYSNLSSGDEFKDPLHAFCEDIDLFGHASFYQYLNRTALDSGAAYLASLLKENSIDSIERKQEAIKELASKPDWRQEFSATASLVKTEVNVQEVVTWLKGYKTFTKKWIKPVSLAFTIVSVALMVTYYFELISGYILFGWFLAGLAITGRYLKKINELASHTSKIESTFTQFYKLISILETAEFSSEILLEKKKLVVNPSQKASSVVKKFAKYLDALDQRSNMLIGVLANGFMLRDLRQSHNIENWITAHRGEVKQWFDVITFFDAFNSLGTYAFNHPAHHFPGITKNAPILECEGAVHPLLNAATAVKNDFKIDKQEFFIVTGANMAGKSTFLRTVALQIVMANVGLPTRVDKAKYTPIKLITSMRTTDSLTDDTSYFFSELKRLKYIVDAIKADRYFIILDEILKGTNSTDKAIGSRKFVEKLVKSGATGIIATHDLSLCETATAIPQVKNYFFDARIENDELYFDYTFKPGVCQNMNASFLLKKMEIVE